MSSPDSISRFVKSVSHSLGFDYCGISKAGFLEEEASRLDKWLQKDMHGEMAYMANHFDKRLDPTLLVEGARSVITLMYNYFPEEPLPTENNYQIARYAYGKDYHFIIKDKLKDFLEQLRAKYGQIEGRVFVDSAPVMERAWAVKSGAGWVGKNSLLLNKHMGSYFFLAEMIIDLEMEYDGPVKDYCGTCTRCIDACPTQAIVEPYVVDGSKCISYFTIELKDNIPDEFQSTYKDWIFGCDICQEVCPWNRFSRPHKEPEFNPNEKLKDFRNRDWEELTEEVFNRIFKNSPLKRTKYKGIQRNIAFVKK